MTSQNRIIVIMPSFCVGICISLLILPFSWVVAWFMAGLVHELGHFIALKMLRIPVVRITIGFQGAYMETGYMRPIAEMLCALAGPIAGLCCLFAHSYIPLLAICAFVQSIYNLLPFPDYDGGRVISALIDCIFPHSIGKTIYWWFLLACAAILVILGAYMWLVAKLGPVFLLIVIIPIMKSGIIKIPCKQGKQIVQ